MRVHKGVQEACFVSSYARCVSACTRMAEGASCAPLCVVGIHARMDVHASVRVKPCIPATGRVCVHNTQNSVFYGFTGELWTRTPCVHTLETGHIVYLSPRAGGVGGIVF